MAGSPKERDHGLESPARRRSSFQKHSGSLEQFFKVAKKLDPVIRRGYKKGGNAAADVRAVREERMRQLDNGTTL
jgi:hypothetical protein